MNSILYALFEDNPGLPEEVYRFCLARPAYRAAERDYRAAMDRAAGSLDRELFLDLDQAVGAYLAQEVRAYYLFGLGLRRQVLDALAADADRSEEIGDRSYEIGDRS